jgi:hypothetical protein
MLEEEAAFWDSGIAVAEDGRRVGIADGIPKMLQLPGEGQFLSGRPLANYPILPAPGLSYTEQNRWSS